MIWWNYNWFSGPFESRPGLGGNDLGGTRGATGALRATEIFISPPAFPPSPATSQVADAPAPGPFLQEQEARSSDCREFAAWSLVGALIGFAAFVVWFIYVAFVEFGFLNLLGP